MKRCFDGEEYSLGTGWIGDDSASYEQWTFEYLGDNSEGDPVYYIYVAGEKLHSLYYNGFSLGLANSETASFSKNCKWTIEYISGGYYLRHVETDKYLNVSFYGTPGMVDNALSFRKWYFAEIQAILPIQGEGQESETWCWVATARMFARYYYPQITATQQDVAVTVKGDDAYTKGGNVEESVDAIEIFLARYVTESPSLSWYYEQVYTASTMARLLDDGHVIWCAQGEYDLEKETGDYSREGGHAVIVYGYVIMENQYWFLLWDPLPPYSNGTMQLISYTNFYNGQETELWEQTNHMAFDRVIAMQTSYSNNTIPSFYEQ